MNSGPYLYIDADSCPRQIRSIILKAVVKRHFSSIFVANRLLPDVTKIENKKLVDNFGTPLVQMIVVENKEDSADDKLVELALEGTIAITRDIILADRLINKGLTVLDDRGNIYTKENIKSRLSERNVMTQMRQWGIFAEKTKAMGAKEVQAFANALDYQLTILEKKVKQK